MFALRIVLFALCATNICALNQQCVEKITGHQTNIEVENQTTFTIFPITALTIPDGCPKPMRRVGMKIVACDSPLSPLILVFGNKVTITRMPPYIGSAKVDILEYCK